jgi:hypothetical protein
MNRSLFVFLIAILLILLSSLTLGAQSRGHFEGGRGFNTTPVVTPGRGFNVTPGTAAGFRPPLGVARPPFAVAPGRGPSFGGHPVHPVHPIRPGFGFGFGTPVFSYYSPYIYPSTIYGAPDYIYPYSGYSQPGYSQPAYTYPDTTAPAVSRNEIDLAYQVGQLSAQVEQLRQQQQTVNSYSYTQPSPEPQQAQPVAKTPTVLVFQDGRRMEIQNYAIVGDTLWVLDQTVANKILISDLDITATQSENHSRGVRFQLPEK